MAGLKKVLIVEDNELIRELYHNVLEQSGYETQAVGGAEELFTKLQDFHPECILLDLMLPGKSGLDILIELRANPVYGCQNTKIIILTNIAQLATSNQAVASGADGYIIKTDINPIELPQIIESLEQ